MTKNSGDSVDGQTTPFSFHFFDFSEFFRKCKKGNAMKEFTVINPVSGKGKADANLQGYLTTGAGDCRKYVRQQCLVDPETHFYVCGGDGTLNEAVNGIFDAGAGKSALLTAVPRGSGNDTVKTANTYGLNRVFDADLILCNDHVSINMLNIGFDCNVVALAGKIKKNLHIAGSLSYLLGVMGEFFRPFGEPFRISALCADGSNFDFDEPALLCAVCNGQWCGGSFHSSPLSDMTDGILELVLVRKTSRVNFLKLIRRYKDGTYIDRSGKVRAEFEKVLIYKRIRSMTISGCRQICFDGEIRPCDSARISVLPGAIRYKTQK